MNNIYLFDLDGTLCINGKVPDSAKKTLKKLREKNNIVMLSTGRNLCELGDFMKQLDVDGAILNNGALAIYNDEVFYSNPIAPEIIKKMINDGLHVGMLSKDNYVKVNDNHPVFSSFAKAFTINEAIEVPESFIDEDPIYSLGVYSNQLMEVNIKKYPELRFVRICEIGYDVMNKGVNKASPISILRKKFKGYHIIAFGDNVNDIEMLEEADVAIVMPTAPKTVKSLASFITKDLLDDGIYYAVHDYLKAI